MQAVHKYTLAAKRGVHSLKVRKDANLLKIAPQGTDIALWFEVDTHNDWQELFYIIYLTGEPFDSEVHKKAKYEATVLFDEGSFVLHIYQITQS